MGLAKIAVELLGQALLPFALQAPSKGGCVRVYQEPQDAAGLHACIWPSLAQALGQRAPQLLAGLGQDAVKVLPPAARQQGSHTCKHSTACAKVRMQSSSKSARLGQEALGVSPPVAQLGS